MSNVLKKAVQLVDPSHDLDSIVKQVELDGKKPIQEQSYGLPLMLGATKAMCRGLAIGAIAGTAAGAAYALIVKEPMPETISIAMSQGMDIGAIGDCSIYLVRSINYLMRNLPDPDLD